MVPFVVTFVFALRKSSLGLILGIITHLVILLGKFMMPVNRPESKKSVIYLEGMCMYPSGDVSIVYLTLTTSERSTAHPGIGCKFTSIQFL